MILIIGNMIPLLYYIGLKKNIEKYSFTELIGMTAVIAISIWLKTVIVRKNDSIILMGTYEIMSWPNTIIMIEVIKSMVNILGDVL